jgi:hypothetical protein
VETRSFEEKDGSEGCRKRLRVRGEVRAYGGELYPTQRPPFDRASLCARPPCSMPVADSQPEHGSQGLREGCWRAGSRLPTRSRTLSSSAAGQRALRATISCGKTASGLHVLRWCVCVCAAHAGTMGACGCGAAEGFDKTQKALLRAICDGHDRGRWASFCCDTRTAPLRRLRASLCRFQYACVRCVNRTGPNFAVPGDRVVAQCDRL